MHSRNQPVGNASMNRSRNHRRRGSIRTWAIVVGIALLGGFLWLRGRTPSIEPTVWPSSSTLPAVLDSPLIPAVPDLTPIVFIDVPGGTVRMGSVSSEPGRDPLGERTVTVTVCRFRISETEITNAQYLSMMGSDEGRSGSDAEMPITGITWYQATQFCELMTVKTGVRHRLATEAEWEYACRAGSLEMMSVWDGRNSIEDAVTAYHRGDIGKLLRGIKASCNVDTGEIQRVGEFPPNPFGLYDMHGNCWEWVSLTDTFSETPSPLHAPIRGGSAISTNAFECRSANRAWQFMDHATESIGFRVVREED